eukprot:scaffold26104_cov122-Isochrysis_galbana.AAC.3
MRRTDVKREAPDGRERVFCGVWPWCVVLPPLVACACGLRLCDCANMAMERTPTRNTHTSHPHAHALLERPHRPPRTAALSHQNTMHSPPVSHRARAIALL